MLTAHVTRDLMSELVIFKLNKSVVLHDTKCLYCDQVSFNNTGLEL